MADPGFPPRVGVNPLGGKGREHTFLPNSPKKLHEIEIIWMRGGGGVRPKFYYVDPPMLRIHRITEV